MSLYGPIFHVTPVDLCIIFQCNLYIYPVSCLMEIKLFQNLFNKKLYLHDMDQFGVMSADIYVD